MTEHAEIHTKIFSFLLVEWGRKDNRQLVEVELLFSPGNGYKDELIRKWVRADTPEFFAELPNVEKLVSQVVEIADGDVETRPGGKYRYTLRAHQLLGERTVHPFSMSPSYKGNADETAMMPAGAGGGGRDQQVIANHAGQLMRINAQMFEGTIRVLGQQNMSLHEQLSALTAENANLRRELEEARSNKMDREFQLAMAAEKNARTNAGFQKLLQIGSVVVAKIGASAVAGAGGDGPGDGAQSPIAMLLGEFYNSLRPEQMGVLMQSLDMGQKMMFMEIVNLVRPPEPKGDGKQGPATGAPSGAPPG